MAQMPHNITTPIEHNESRINRYEAIIHMPTKLPHAKSNNASKRTKHQQNCRIITWNIQRWRNWQKRLNNNAVAI